MFFEIPRVLHATCTIKRRLKLTAVVGAQSLTLCTLYKVGAHTCLNSSALKRVNQNCRVITEKSARNLVPKIQGVYREHMSVFLQGFEI